MPPRRRYKAPAGNGEILADPPFRRVPELVEQNRQRLDRKDVKVGSMSLREMRELARYEVLLEAGRTYFSERPCPDPERVAESIAQDNKTAPLLLAERAHSHRTRCCRPLRSPASTTSSC